MKSPGAGLANFRCGLFRKFLTPSRLLLSFSAIPSTLHALLCSGLCAGLCLGLAASMVAAMASMVQDCPFILSSSQGTAWSHRWLCPERRLGSALPWLRMGKTSSLREFWEPVVDGEGFGVVVTISQKDPPGEPGKIVGIAFFLCSSFLV